MWWLIIPWRNHPKKLAAFLWPVLALTFPFQPRAEGWTNLGAWRCQTTLKEVPRQSQSLPRAGCGDWLPNTSCRYGSDLVTPWFSSPWGKRGTPWDFDQRLHANVNFARQQGGHLRDRETNEVWRLRWLAMVNLPGSNRWLMDVNGC